MDKQKTKTGIAIGAAGAIVYFAAMLGGYTPLFILGFYIFLREDSLWLKKAVFKAVVLMLVFSAMCAVVDTLNEILGIFNNIFELELEIPLGIDVALKNAVSIAKTVLFSVLGFRAVWKKSVKISTIDNAFRCDDEIIENTNGRL